MKTWRGRLQLQALLFFGGLLFLLLFVGHAREQASVLSRLDDRLQLAAAQLRLGEAELGPVSYAAIWNEDGSLQRHEGTAGPILQETANTGESLSGVEWRWRSGGRERWERRPDGTVVLVGCNAAAVEAALATVTATYRALGLGLLLAMIVGGTWWARWQVRPLERLTADAQTIADGRLGDLLVETGRGRELDALAGVCNVAFRRLHEALHHEVVFMSSVSHQLRTPLAILINECEWALEKRRNEEDHRSSMGLCRRTSMEMRELLESLLLVARLNANAYELDKEPFCLGNLVQEACGTVVERARERGVRIRTALHEVTVRADERRIRQTVSSLLRHAIAHSRRGQEISVRMTERDEALLVEVEDQGPGIARPDLGRVFDPGFERGVSQGDESDRTGVSMGINRAIARAHGGDLRLRSAGSIGCAFVLELPRGRREAPQPHRSARVLRADIGGLKSDPAGSIARLTQA